MRRRAGLSGGNSPASWAGRRLASKPGYAAIDATPSPQAPPPPREHHRAIPAPSASRYRVVRRFRVHGELQIEDIGAFTSVYPAYVLLARELSNAILLAPNGTQLSNNWQPVEEREP